MKAIILILTFLVVSSCSNGDNQSNSTSNTSIDYVQQLAPVNSNYTLDQAVSDNAQVMTIAFSGLSFITGNTGADTFFPPGKLADFFGFQYMRDVDIAGYGHNTLFLSRVANNVLKILTVEQKAKLVALAKEQSVLYIKYAYNRFPLMNAFRRNLTGNIPLSSTGLNREKVAEYSAKLYLIDADLSYRRAIMMGEIVQTLTSEQKSYLAKMTFNDFNTWPDVPEDSEIKKGMTNAEFVSVMTYASEFFSWYKGGINADIYFCPERHGTYFGGFFLKDYPAMKDPNYFIPLDQTGKCGSDFLNTLTAEQRLLITSITDEQKTIMNEIVQIRESVSKELRRSMNGQSVDKTKIFQLIERYGYLEGSLSGLYAIRFSQVNKTLTSSQMQALITIRNLNVIPVGAFRYSSSIAMPLLPNNDYLFGTGNLPSDAGSYNAPVGFDIN
jgi:Spy/CpxP family protein refolding chaperone